jgi:hypothetical protein
VLLNKPAFKLNFSLESCLGAFLDGWLTYLLIVYLIKDIQLPLWNRPEGVVSYFTVKGWSPDSDYIKFLFFYFPPLAVVFFALKRGTSVLGSLLKRFSILPILLKWTLGGMIVFYAIDYLMTLSSNANNIDSKWGDLYGFGLKVGDIPRIMKTGSLLASVFTMHGFITENLSGFLAYKWGPPGYVMAVTSRIELCLFFMANFMGLLLLFYSIFVYRPPKTHPFVLLLQVVLVSKGVSSFFLPMHFQFDWFFEYLQMFLSIYFVLRVPETNPRKAWVVSWFCGLLWPLSFLNYYGIAIQGVLFAFLTLPFIHIHSPSKFRIWVKGNLLGVACATLACLMIFGWRELYSIVDNISIMLSTGKFWNDWPIFYPLGLDTSYSIAPRPEIDKVGRFMTVQFAALFFCLYQWQKLGMREAVNRFFPIIALLVAAFLDWARILQLSDPGHIFSFSSAMLAVLALSLMIDYQVTGPIINKLKTAVDHRLLLGIAFFILCYVLWSVNLPPVKREVLSFGKFCKVFRDLAPDENYMLDKHRQVVNIMKDEVSRSSCFYVLTNEGAWYHYLGSPSCSRFHGPAFARTLPDQKEVVDSLENGKPEYILFDSNALEQDIYRVNKFQYAAPIVRYVMSHYKPDVSIGEYWFWKRNEAPYMFSDTPVGALEPLPPQLTGDEDVDVKAVLYARHVSQVILFISSGPQREMIWSKRFTVYPQGGVIYTIPVVSLPKGNNHLEFWYIDASSLLHKVGEADFRR